MKSFDARAMWIARGLAMTADVLQVALLPLFGEGAVSPLNIVLDCAVFVALVSLIGFHVALLPSFIVEEVPVLNLAPTWTAAVFLATRKGATARKLPGAGRVAPPAAPDLPALPAPKKPPA